VPMQIRRFERKDYDQWLPLWQENCAHKIADDITAETWRRLTHPKESVGGLGVFTPDDKMIGLLHYVVHPTTGFIHHVCYMQDIFITQDHRKQGLAKRLLWELQDLKKTQNWARIYWFAENNNVAAQNLYKTVGIKMDFSLHMIQDL